MYINIPNTIPQIKLLQWVLKTCSTGQQQHRIQHHYRDYNRMHETRESHNSKADINLP
jgi:hypothetical protein